MFTSPDDVLDQFLTGFDAVNPSRSARLALYLQRARETVAEMPVASEVAPPTPLLPSQEIPYFAPASDETATFYHRISSLGTLNYPSGSQALLRSQGLLQPPRGAPQVYSSPLPVNFSLPRPSASPPPPLPPFVPLPGPVWTPSVTTASQAQASSSSSDAPRGTMPAALRGPSLSMILRNDLMATHFQREVRSSGPILYSSSDATGAPFQWETQNAPILEAPPPDADPPSIDDCPHPKPWKRLRAKRGFTFFACRDCGAKWRLSNPRAFLDPPSGDE